MTLPGKKKQTKEKNEKDRCRGDVYGRPTNRNQTVNEGTTTREQKNSLQYTDEYI